MWLNIQPKYADISSVLLRSFYSFLMFSLFHALITNTCIFLLVRKCDKFPVPTNGVIKGGQCDNRDYLSFCEVICNTGYELSGNGKRTCVINGANAVVWSGSDVQCRRKFTNVKSRILNSISMYSKSRRLCLTFENSPCVWSRPSLCDHSPRQPAKSVRWPPFCKQPRAILVGSVLLKTLH